MVCTGQEKAPVQDTGAEWLGWMMPNGEVRG